MATTVCNITHDASGCVVHIVYIRMQIRLAVASWWKKPCEIEIHVLISTKSLHEVSLLNQSIKESVEQKEAPNTVQLTYCVHYTVCSNLLVNCIWLQAIAELRLPINLANSFERKSSDHLTANSTVCAVSCFCDGDKPMMFNWDKITSQIHFLLITCGR